MNKKNGINSNTNNNNKTQYSIMNHNLSKYCHKKNNENISLLDKIKDNHKKMQII